MTKRKSTHVIPKEPEHDVEEMSEMPETETANNSKEVATTDVEDIVDIPKNNDVMLPRSASRYVKPLR